MSGPSRSSALLVSTCLMAAACAMPPRALAAARVPPLAQRAPSSRRRTQAIEQDLVGAPAQDTAQEDELALPVLSARFFTSPSELRDELPVHEIAPRLYAGVEAESQGGYERKDGKGSWNGKFEGATGALRWVPMYGLVATFEGSVSPSDGLELDELLVTLGAAPTEPWYISVGHTDLPFGEFNSHFREDPATQLLGEIQSNEIAAGYETDYIEFTGAINEGKSDNGSYSLIGNFTCSPVQDMDAGLFWTNDLTESHEIRDLIDDFDGTGSESRVQGSGLFMSLQKRRYSIDFETIIALESFNANVLDDKRRQPWAWNLEGTVRPSALWEVGMRLESSDDLPKSPEYQFGPEMTYSFNEHLAMSIEFLYGTFEDKPDRCLVTVGLLTRW